jgi:flagellar motor switch protein FliG
MKNHSAVMRKAAVLLASLDGPMADELLEQLTADESRAIREAMTSLGDIDTAEQNIVIEEFFRISPLVPDKSPAGIELDDSAPQLWQSPEPPEKPFRVLTDTPDEALAGYLEREHPQTVAIVMAHLPSDRAANLLGSLPADLQGQVAMRLVHLEKTDPTVVREIERGMQSWITQQTPAPKQRAPGMETLKGILSAADDRAKQSILRSLGHHDPNLAGRLSAPRRVIEFAEVATFDDRSLTKLFSQAPPEIVRLALVGMDHEFIDRVLRLLPPKSAHWLRDQLEHLAPTRLSDVEQAQQELAHLATKLESESTERSGEFKRLSIAV